MSQALEFLEYPELLGLGVVRSISRGRTQPRHVHDSLCFGHVLEGKRLLRMDGDEYALEPGTCMIVHPGRAHEVVDMPGTQATMFSLPESSISTLAGELYGPGSPGPEFPAVVLDDPRLFGLMVELDQSLAELGHAPAQCPSATAHGDILSCEDGLLSVVSHLLTCHSSVPNSPAEPVTVPHGAVERARFLLEERFADGIGLKELAAAAGLSPCWLNRAFSRSVGVPPGEYCHHLRVRRAKALLRAGASLVDAALETGYADQSHFTRAFVRITGMTPGTYRKGVLAAPDS